MTTPTQTTLIDAEAPTAAGGHTPGPWQMVVAKDGIRYIHTRGLDVGRAFAFDPSTAEPIPIANAYLMAAAPELLEAAICEQDAVRFAVVNFGARMEIVSRWLRRLDEVLPLGYDRHHEAHAAWTQGAFTRLPETLRAAAIAKATGGPL